MSATSTSNVELALHAALGVMSHVFGNDDIFKCAHCSSGCVIDQDGTSAVVLPCKHVMHSHCLRTSTIENCPLCSIGGRQISIQALRASLPLQLDPYVPFKSFFDFVRRIGSSTENLSPIAIKDKVVSAWSRLPHADLPADFPARDIFAEPAFPQDDDMEAKLEQASNALHAHLEQQQAKTEFPFSRFAELVTAISSTYDPSTAGAALPSSASAKDESQAKRRQVSAAVAFPPASSAPFGGAAPFGSAAPFGGMMTLAPQASSSPVARPAYKSSFAGQAVPQTAKFVTKTCGLCKQKGWEIGEPYAFVPDVYRGEVSTKTGHVECVNKLIASKSAAAADE